MAGSLVDRMMGAAFLNVATYEEVEHDETATGQAAAVVAMVAVAMALGGWTATWGELLRTLGFAQAPGILAVLAIIPVLGWFVLLGVSVWVAVAAFIAIRQALDISNGKTFLTVLVGFIVSMVLSGILPGSL
jgi:cytochrome bd-type quinol oxidase subunit 2